VPDSNAQAGPRLVVSLNKHTIRLSDSDSDHSDRDSDTGMRALHKAPGRRGILGRGLRAKGPKGGGPGRPPFWRTLVSPTERAPQVE